MPAFHMGPHGVLAPANADGHHTSSALLGDGLETMVKGKFPSGQNFRWHIWLSTWTGEIPQCMDQYEFMGSD